MCIRDRLIRNSIVVEYGIDYFNQHYRELQRFQNVEEFSKGFNLSEKAWNDILQIAKNQEIESDPENIKSNKALILNALKSEIARLLFGDTAYYYVFLQDDDIYQHAVEFIN